MARNMASALSAILGLLLFAGVQCVPAHVGVTNDSFDYLLFVQRNPPGVCFGTGNCGYPSNATVWTIHGLWPTDENSENPNYCNNSATFDSKTLESLWPRLVAEWTNLMPNTAFDSFWKHEYLKHGTCAAVLPDLSTEFKFFSTVLNLFEEKYNFPSVLNNAGITPSNTTAYSYDQFINAFKKAFNVIPFLECYYKDKQQVISQIYLCLTKDFVPQDCSEFVYHEGDKCWKNETVYYLQSKYSDTTDRNVVNTIHHTL